MKHSSPLFLAIDTANSFTSIALGTYETLLGSAHDDTPSRQAERLIPMIDDLLRVHALTYKDISGIIIHTGPGSFTGIRIGLAAAKGYKIALGCPIYGITGYEAYAYKLFQLSPSNTLPMIILHDANREELVIAQASCTGELMGDPWLLNLIDVETMLLQTSPSRLIGSGIAKLSEASRLRHHIIDEAYPNACDILPVGIAAHHSGRKAGAEPFYIRPPDAKAKLI